MEIRSTKFNRTNTKSDRNGILSVEERIFKSVNGDIISKTTKITGKGQVFLMAKIKKSLGIEPIERKVSNHKGESRWE